MDKTITYTNGAGESVRFAAGGPWHYRGTDLRDHAWKADTVNDRAVGFRLRPREFTIEAVMDGASPVSWGGQFGFDVALVEERSEPAWS